MNLNINMPAYYTREYGVIDEIYIMCKEISESVRNNKYSEVVDTIGITPIVAPKEKISIGLWKERNECEVKYGFVSVSLWIDYEHFIESDIAEKKKLVLENILRSIKVISKRAKLDKEALINDIRLSYQEEGIDVLKL